MKKVDISTWSRRKQYQNFIAYSHPVFSIGTTLDVTSLVQYCKRHNQSFFSAFVYLVTCAANNTEAFRTRILHDDVVIYDRVHPSYVVLCEDGGLSTCRTMMADDYDSFYRQSRADIEKARVDADDIFDDRTDADCLYISCLPWVDICSFSNPYHFENREQTSIPRITWGKYTQKDGGYKMYLDVSMHHALADGLHVAQFIQKLEAALAAIEKEGIIR